MTPEQEAKLKDTSKCAAHATHHGECYVCRDRYLLARSAYSLGKSDEQERNLEIHKRADVEDLSWEEVDELIRQRGSDEGIE